jgi:hypothetical protein
VKRGHVLRRVVRRCSPAWPQLSQCHMQRLLSSQYLPHRLCLSVTHTSLGPYRFSSMPPKVSRQSSKRKMEIDSDESGEEASQGQVAKKSKTMAVNKGSEPGGNGQPTNMTLPDNISFLPKSQGALRISSWNVVSLASASKKGA